MKDNTFQDTQISLKGMDESSKELLSCCVAARTRPLLFSNLLMAAQNNVIHSHPLFSLMSSLFFTCYNQRRGLLIQAPPEHGKTSFIIPALIWVLAHKQNLKIGVVSKDKDLAEEHLIKIRKGMVSTTRQYVFPDMEPDYNRSVADKGEWSKEKLYLVGETEPAFERYTLLGASEGHRLDIIWCDDCVTRDCQYSEAMRRRTASAMFETFANRLTDNGMMVVSNNCWHKEDAIHQIKASDLYTTLWVGYNDLDSMYYEILHPPRGWKKKKKGTFPLWKQWPKKRLLKKMKSPGSSWKRLWEGKAVAPEDCRFPPMESWARWETLDLEKGKLYGYLDIAGGKTIKKNDFYALIVILTYPDNIHDLVDCVIDRAPPSKQVESVFTMHKKWAMLQEKEALIEWDSKRGFGFHRVAIEMLPKEQLWLKELFKSRREELRKEEDEYWQVPFRVDNPKENKELRIERIEPFLENGWLRFPFDLAEIIKRNDNKGRSWRRLVNQLEEWPFSDHDDGPDALAGDLVLAGTKANRKLVSSISL